MVQATADRPHEADHPLLSLSKKIDELFVHQYDRIAFHNNDENGYQREEERLSSLMVDKALTDAEHAEHARAVLALTEKYTGSFVHSLQSVNADIDRHLAAFAHTVDGVSGQASEPTAELTTLLENVRRWLILSKELQAARLLATQTIVMRVDCDKMVPNAIIRNDGAVDVMLPSEETATFQQILTDVSVMLKQSFEDNERIQRERLPLSQALFGSEPTSSEAKAVIEPSAHSTVKPPRIHPLEGKAWFRLFKVAYIGLWIIAAGLCLLFAFSGDDGNLALGTAVISVLVLVGLRKGFYYVMLGRTTVSEPPGTGFLDWDEMNNDFDSLKASNPEFYQTVAAPFLASWKQQYDRRVPIHAYEVFRKRVDTELEELRTKKQKLIDDAAKKGTVIEISVLRQDIEKTKAEYQRSDRAAYVRGIDDWILRLEAQYGTSIPVDEASKLLDDLEVKIREQEKS